MPKANIDRLGSCTLAASYWLRCCVAPEGFVGFRLDAEAEALKQPEVLAIQCKNAREPGRSTVRQKAHGHCRRTISIVS